MPNEGDLKVWWIPQVPMRAFKVPVKNEREADLIISTLARYDIFQYENNVKPDFSNAGGLLIYECGEWTDWYKDDKSGYWDDFDEYRHDVLRTANRRSDWPGHCGMENGE